VMFVLTGKRIRILPFSDALANTQLPSLLQRSLNC
jgi:hypothetical protein